MADVILDADAWYRYGHGRGLELFITDDELAEVLNTYLPKEYAPYTLQGYLVVEEDDHSVLDPFTHHLQEFLNMRQQGITNFYLRSLAITPSFPVRRAKELNRLYSLNGFINFQHGRQRLGCWEDTLIGCVGRVANSITGDVWEHTEYLRLFSVLKRQLTKITQRTSLRPGLANILISTKMLQKYKMGEICLTSNFQYDPLLLPRRQ